MTITTQSEVIFQRLPSSSSTTYGMPGKPIFFGKMIKVKLAKLQNTNNILVGHRLQATAWLSYVECLLYLCQTLDFSSLFHLLFTTSL